MPTPSQPRRPRAPTAGTSTAKPVIRSSSAAEHAKKRNAISFRLPVVGSVSLPSAPHLAWYAGVGVLATAGVIELPIALCLVIGKVLTEDRSNKTLQDFGDALQAAG